MTLKATKTSQDVVRDLEKKYGELFSSGRIKPKDIIPFSDPFLNYATRGGVRCGASTEIVGEPSTGKSTLAMDLIGNAQKIFKENYEKEKEEKQKRLEGKLTPKQKTTLEQEIEDLKEKRVLFADIEGTYTTRWAQYHGVDVDKMDVLRPMAAGSEIMLDYVVDLASTGEYGLIVVDSIGVMISTAEYDSEIGKGNYGGIAKMLTKFYKAINSLVLGHNIALVMINQTRQDMAGYNQLVRPGGKMNEYAQSLVIHLTPKGSVGEDLATISRREDTIYAVEINARVAKNKAAASDIQNSMFTIVKESGIDTTLGLVNLMDFTGDLIQTGSWYTVANPRTGEVLEDNEGKQVKVQGKRRIQEFFEENQDIRDEIIKHYYEKSISNLGALDEGEDI